MRLLRANLGTTLSQTVGISPLPLQYFNKIPKVSYNYIITSIMKPSEMPIWGYSSFFFYARDVSGFYRRTERIQRPWTQLHCEALLLSRYRYLRSLLERILTALTSRTLIIRNCFPDDNTLRMRAFLKNQNPPLAHLSEVSLPNEMEMRREVRAPIGRLPWWIKESR